MTSFYNHRLVGPNLATFLILKVTLKSENILKGFLFISVLLIKLTFVALIKLIRIIVVGYLDAKSDADFV